MSFISRYTVTLKLKYADRENSTVRLRIQLHDYYIYKTRLLQLVCQIPRLTANLAGHGNSTKERREKKEADRARRLSRQQKDCEGTTRIIE